MQKVIGGLATLLLAGTLLAQDAPVYKDADNPFQAEFAMVPGQPVELLVATGGVGFDTVTLTPLGDTATSEAVPCEVRVIGRGVGDRKAAVTLVLLLEDADGKSLERLSLQGFKVKAGRTFDEAQRLAAPGPALQRLQKVYVFAQVD